MKLSLAFLTAAAPVLVSGKRLKKTARATLAETDLSNVKIDATSKTGNKLLSKARRLDGDGDSTWIAGYSLKFHSCTQSEDYYGGNFNNNDNGQNNGNNNYNGEDYAGMYQQKLVHFKLCPSDSCWRCKNGADYVVELGDFIDSVLEAKMTAQEYQCERVREGCYCQNAYNGEESCMYNCFKNAGFEECAESMYEDVFDIQEAVECAQLEVKNEQAVMNYLYSNMEQPQGNYGNGQDQGGINGDLFVGPYCSKNGKKIHFGVFLEETCSISAPKGIYEVVNYGATLPYSKKSIVSGCISCKEPKEVDYNNYWDNQDPDEATEVCTELYEMAGKCEKNLDGYYPYRDVTGCEFISNLKSSSNISAKVFACIFGVATLAFGVLAAILWKKNQRRVTLM